MGKISEDEIMQNYREMERERDEARRESERLTQRHEQLTRELQSLREASIEKVVDGTAPNGTAYRDVYLSGQQFDADLYRRYQDAEGSYTVRPAEIREDLKIILESQLEEAVQTALNRITAARESQLESQQAWGLPVEDVALYATIEVGTQASYSTDARISKPGPSTPGGTEPKGEPVKKPEPKPNGYDAGQQSEGIVAVTKGAPRTEEELEAERQRIRERSRGRISLGMLT